MSTSPTVRRAGGRSGSVLVIAMIMVVGLGAISMALLSMTGAVEDETGLVVDELSAFYAAEGALVEAWAVLSVQGRDGFEVVDYPLTMEGASYSVQATFGEDDPWLAGDLVRLVATADDGLGAASMELVARNLAWTADPYGVLAGTHLEIDSNSYVDAYCSSEGTWQEQALSSAQGLVYADDDTLVGSNGSIHVDTNSMIFGDASCAPDETISVDGHSSVTGSSAPAQEPFELPVVETPEGSNGSLVVAGTNTVTIGPGTFVYDRLIVKSGSHLKIQGPVELYVKSEFVIYSNSSIEPQSGLPADLSVYVEDGAHDVIMNSNTSLVGSLIAPGCDVSLDSNSQLYGALVGDTITLSSNSGIHADTCLGADDDADAEDYQLLTWRPTSAVEE